MTQSLDNLNIFIVEPPHVPEAPNLSQQLIALCEGCLSIGDIEALGNLSPNVVEMLNEDSAVSALKAGSFTLVDVAGMSDAAVAELLTPACLDVLFCELMAIEQLKLLDAAEIYAAVSEYSNLHSLTSIC